MDRMVLDASEEQERQNGVVRACDMRVMTCIASEASVFVLTRLQPAHNLLPLLTWKLILESSESSQRPVTSCHLEVLCQVLPDGVEVFAVLEAE